MRIFLSLTVYFILVSDSYAQSENFKPILYQMTKTYVDSIKKVLKKYPDYISTKSNTLKEVFILNPIGGSNKIVKALKIDNKIVYQGDILVNDEYEIKDSLDLYRSDGFLRDTFNYWLDGVIPYKFNNNLDAEDRNKIQNAINYINENTMLLVRQKTTNDRDYVTFEQSNMGCLSSLGRVGNEQKIYLSKECTVGNTIHEILHAAGMIHEQSRNDRDDYIIINYNNISYGYSINFEKETRYTKSLLPYDFESIMHYRLKSFAKDTNINTIIPKVSLTSNQLKNIGQRKYMTQSDIAAISYIANANRSPIDSIIVLQNSGQICFKANGNADREFNGHGPKVKYNAEIIRVDAENALDVVVEVFLEETGSDYTKAKAVYKKRILSYDPKLTIKEIRSLLKEDNSNNVTIAEAAKMQFLPFICKDGIPFEVKNNNLKGIVKSIKLIADTGYKDVSDDNNCHCDSKILDIEFNKLNVVLKYK